MSLKLGNQFLRIADVHGSQPAVMAGDFVIDYASFAEAALAYAKIICEDAPERSVVAIQGEPSPTIFAFVLASCIAGRPFMLLDHALPLERRRRMLAACQPGLLLEAEAPGQSLLSRPFVKRLSRAEPALGYWSAWAAAVPSEVPVAYAAETSYLVFTSGSTGTPKGILGCSAGLEDFVEWQTSTFGVEPGDRVAQLTNLSFDVVLRDIFLPLTTGAALVIPPARDRKRPRSLSDWIHRLGISRLHIVPTLASMIAAHASDGDLSSLRTVFFAGEPLSKALIGLWRNAAEPHCQLVNLYGPSETSLAKFFYKVPEQCPESVVPVGCPIPGARAIIVDEKRRGVAPRTIGQVAITTQYRPLGYLDASLNADRFIQIQLHDRLVPAYLTGDLGQLDEDGLLILHGRVDDEVKISGIRINPSEVAALVEELPFVQRCVVLADDDIAYKRLVAVWTRMPGGEGNEAAIRSHLSRVLNPATVPQELREVDRIPLLPNGKVDRARARGTVAYSSEPMPSAVWTERTEALREAWRKVLGHDVGSVSNFFTAGGDSLLAVELVLEVEALGGGSLEAEAVLRLPRFSDLAQHLESKQAEAATATDLPTSTYPLTRPQYGFYRFHVLGHEHRSWSNVVGTVDGLTGAAIDAVMVTLERIARRHPALRTRVIPGANDPRQIIDAQPLVQLRTLRTSDLDFAQHLSSVKARLQQQYFVFSRWPPWCGVLVQAPSISALVIAAHHIVVDGWSMEVIREEIASELCGPRRSLPPLALDYRDIVIWDARVRASDRYGRDSKYAVSLFERYDPPRLALNGQARKGRTYWSVLTDSNHALARKQANEAGVSTFVWYYSAYLLALHTWLPRRDLVTGFLYHGREMPAMHGLVGNFASVRHVRTRANLTGGNGAFSKQVDREYLTALRHRSYEFIDVLDQMGVDSSGCSIPLCSLFFNFRAQRPADRAGNSGRGSQSGFDGLAFEIKHELMQFVEWSERGAVVSYQYCGDVSDQHLLALHDSFLSHLCQ